MADWLGYGLEEVFADAPEIGIVRKIRPYSGLVRYEAHNDALEWPQALKDTLATEKPKVIVVMLRLNDRQTLHERIAPQKSITGQNETATAPSSAEPGQQGSGPAHSAATAPPAAGPAASDASRQVQTVSYDFHTDKWAEAYGKRIDEMIAVLKTNGVPVLWIGLPAIRGTRTIGDISYLNELYRKRAEKAGIAASLMVRDSTQCRARISKARFAGCAAAMGCISPSTARRSSRTISSTTCAAR